ncbi:MAG: hypothetical protein CMM93_02550 [Rickettsiales bacterium]|nr:hypothetical protein [Rickettsiales bacterium]
MFASPLAAIFITIFLAEMGDKTQLAAMLFASENDYNNWTVFAVACVALITSTGIAVLLGSLASKYVNMLPLNLIAGIGFMLLGAWSIYDYVRT